MKRHLIPVLIALLGLAACSKKKEVEHEAVAPVQVEAAHTDTVQRVVAADAIIFPIEQSSIVPKLSAPVRSFNVKRGDHVRKGQLVAVLENRDLAASVAETRGALAQAQATYNTLTAATLPEDVNKAQQDVDAARQALDAAQKVYESRRQLFDQGALARRQVDEANVAYAQAKSQFAIAQKHQQALQSVSRQEQINSSQAQMDSVKARLEGAQVQLAYAQIYSPIDGVVTDRPLWPGEMAAAGTPLMTIMNVSQVVARANVPVAQAAFVRLGNPARITQADTGIEIHGKVTVVSPATDPNSTTVEVWVQGANPGEKLKPGSAARVEVVTQVLPEALVIAKSALLPGQEGTGTSVMVVNGDVAHQKTVETGIRDGDKVQVLSGVKAGELVVTTGGVGLQDGGKVRVVKPGEKDKDDDKKDEKPEKK